jgi:hypothetical protein
MGEQRRRGFLMAVAMLIAAPGTVCAQTVFTVERDGFQASVRTLGYDQTASFFLGRGLPPPLADRYARDCVLLVVLHSEVAKASVTVRLGDWRVRAADGAEKRIRGRGDWLAELDREGISRAARIGFEMVQLPEEIDMNAGDSIQGMLSIPVSRGKSFYLIVRWKVGEDAHEASIEGIRCD